MVQIKNMKISSGVIYGIRARLVRFFMITNILIIAVLSYKNPFKGLRSLKRIIKRRESVQGLPRIRKYIKGGHRFFISENIPGWPSSAFNGFVRAEVKRSLTGKVTAPLSTVIFAVTSKCRLRCPHCYEWENLSLNDVLTLDNLKTIMTRLKETGINHIQLSGGEPLERFNELVDLITFGRQGVDIWLLTSGMEFTYEKSILLKKSGLTGADISLDSWSESEHNRSRNNTASFHWVMKAAENCRKAGLLTSFSLCAFREFVNEENLIKYLELAKASGVGFVRLLEPRKAGRYKDKEIQLEPAQIKLLECFFRDVNTLDKYLDYPIVTFPGYAQRRTGCSGAGNRYLYIDSVGNIHACPFCQKSTGNALTDTLESVIPLLKNFGCHEFEMNLSD